MNRRALVLATASLLAAACFVAAPGHDAVAQEPAGESEFKNVQVLKHVKSKAEMRQIMKAQSAALGVKCTHCHVQGKFELDDKKEKLVAREMLKMVASLNATTFKDFEPKPSITCWTCHRGSVDVERDIPQSAFDAIDAQK